MTDVEASRRAAEDRVQQFMIEFDAQWRIAEPEFAVRDPDDPRRAFALWHELMEQTTAKHFTASPATELGGSFGRPAEYGPDAETFVRSEVEGDIAYVVTQTTSILAYQREYTLHRSDDGWRIHAIADHSGDPTAPFVEGDVIDQRVAECEPDTAFATMPEAQASLDEVKNFTEREVTARNGETTRTIVSSIGSLSTTSGVLSVIDFGYDNDDARPLTHTVPPGSYPVDRVTAFGRNAAVRVRFSEADPTTWHPASIPGSGHVVGVDAGCICIADYVGYASMSPRTKAAADGEFTGAPRPAALQFSLDAQNKGIAVDSGYGDGSYPVYWGVDEQGRVAQLVVDFMVLAEQDDEGVLRTV